MADIPACGALALLEAAVVASGVSVTQIPIVEEIRQNSTKNP